VSDQAKVQIAFIVAVAVVAVVCIIATAVTG
jgi:hypothetical protein